MARMRLTVACVLRSGGAYVPEHVEALQHGVSAHLSLPHRFICLTDMRVACASMPLRHGWPGWWSKIELFRGSLPRPVFYLDLDTVIVGSLDDLVLGHRFTMLHSMSRPTHPGSGVMAWDMDVSHVYDAFLSDPERWMRECTTPDCWGDQGFIFRHLGLTPDYWQDRYPGRVVSYKVHCRGGVCPPGASIVAYHGRPRPWEAPLRRIAA